MQSQYSDLQKITQLQNTRKTLKIYKKNQPLTWSLDGNLVKFSSQFLEELAKNGSELQIIKKKKKLAQQNWTTKRRCHEKTSYVLNYAFITLLHEWVDRGQMHPLEKLLCV